MAVRGDKLVARAAAAILSAGAALWLPLVALSQEGAPGGGPTRLTRRAALQTAAAQNIEVLSERLARDASAHAAGASRREFVPVIALSSSYDDTFPADDPTAPQGETPERPRAIDASAGVAWRAPSGTSVDLSVSQSHALTGDRDDDPAIGMSVTQPLLRGGWRAGAAAGMHEADLEAEIQREAFRSYLNDFLAQVDAAYWDLAFGQADIEITRRSLERAKGQYEDTKENIRRGLLPETDIYVVEENVVSFEQQLLEAEQRLADASSRMAALLQQRPGSRYTAVDALDFDPVLPDAAAATREALEDHPSLAARRLALEKAHVKLAYSRNQALPALDLTASFSLNGVAGSASKAWAEVAGADKPAFGVGLSFSMPLWLGPELADVRGDEAETKRQLLALKLEETRLAFAVEDALAQLATEKKRLVLARRIYELAEKKLEAEVEKYKNGVSRLPEVVRFQRELDSALLSFRAVQKKLLVSYAQLRRTEGRLDRDAGVSVR
jgi:outer membrane protein TolC